MSRKRAIILLSGGIDSATTLALARERGYFTHCISVRYGQRHIRELDAAVLVARQIGTDEHSFIDIDLRSTGHSALTDTIPVPKGRSPGEMAGRIPVTYVPARNTVFLSYALAYAEVLEAPDIFIGANSIDYSGYPDCRPEYIAAFEKMANLAIEAAVEGRLKISIQAPLIHLTKAEIIAEGQRLGVDFSLTHSCYDPSPEGKACGFCDSCILRRKGFLEARVPDPTVYSPDGLR